MKVNLGKKMFLLLIILSAKAYAQKDVTQFLDIPVDGYKSEMIKKLKSRGYTIVEGTKDIFEGEFNGQDVNISMLTNNNKVWRIAVLDKNYTNETNIKIRFNTLIQQFQNNDRYLTETDSIVSKFIIPDDEDISYEMGVNSKRYQAVFSQEMVTSESFIQRTDSLKNGKLSEEEIEKKRLDLITELIKEAFKAKTNKQVWFMIDEKYGKYRILMFYDNDYNKANGEGL